jgi:signal transduction histidine kinase/ligand-binding sensor domain-containing protein/CheY-like chemotaxis protein
MIWSQRGNKVKKKQTMRLAFTLWILFCSLIAHATGPSARFDRLSIEDGLSQNTVSGIVQDNQGFLWVATHDGLNRYDGYEFKTYEHDPQDPHSLTANYISSVFLDNKGALWVSTASGLNRYDTQNDRFERFVHDPNNSNSLSNNNVRTVVEDRRGILWIATYGGLNWYDRVSNRFGHFEHQNNDPKGLAANNIRILYLDGKDQLWIGTRSNGLDKFDSVSGHFEHFKNQKDNPHSLSHDRILSITEDAQGQLWVGTVGGLNRYDAKNGQFIRYKHDPSDITSLSHSSILSLKTDSKGRLWVGTASGLNRFDAQRQRFLHWQHQASDPHSLSTNTIWSIFEDQQSVLWVGTASGLNKYDLGRDRFVHYNNQQTDKHSLSENNIMTLHETGDGSLWIGTAGGGLDRFDANSRQFVHYRHDPNNASSLKDDNVFTVYEDASNTLWVGNAGGLSKFDRQNNEFEHWPFNEMAKKSVSPTNISALVMDGENALWIGTYQDGLYKYDQQSGEVIHFQSVSSNAASLGHNSVRSILLDSKGQLWIGMLGGGLDKYDPDSGGFVHYRHQPSNPTSLSNDYVNVIIEGRNGVLWLGTRGGGLNRFESEQAGFTAYRVKDGLVNDTIYGILEDESGNFWMSTNRGISKFNPATGRFRNFDDNDGLQSNEFNEGAYLRGRNGELFFGGINGFNRFFPQNIQEDNKAPKVVLTDLLLFNQSVPISPSVPGEGNPFSINKSINTLKSLSLSYQQSLITFGFSALHFANPMKNQYAFKLEGWDKDWIYANAKMRLATYTNIPAGEYTFVVKASNKDGYWNEQGTSLKISVSPPPWKTWWAYSSYVLMFVAFVAAIFRYEHLKVVKEREINKRLEKKVKQRTLALERATDAKSDFLAKMSHEIRTPMNAVIGLSRLTLKTRLDHQQKDHIEKVVDAGEALLGLINDILDFSKIEAGKLTIESTQFKLQTLLQRSINLSAMNAHVKGLELVTDVDSNMPLVLVGDPLRLQQIIVNLVNNAVKFTEKGAVCIKVAIKEEIEHHLLLQCSVIDTGIGMSEEQQSKMFQSFSQADDSMTRKFGGTGLGLSISKQLCELMGGEIWLESELGKGSVFHFTVRVDKLAKADEVVNIDLAAIAKLKALVVDDIPMARKVLLNILAELGIEADKADNGPDAIELIRTAIQGGRPYDLVLMDWRMPGLDGIETTERIHQEHLDDSPHILMVSAYDKDEARTQLSNTQINQFMEKPISQGAMLDAISRMLADRSNHFQDIDLVDEDPVPNFSSSHLLLVEDNAINRQVAIGFLKDTGVHIDIAENGVIAVDKVQQVNYDLVLMDIQMPEMDGITATKEIRNTLKMTDLPVVAMTAHAMAADIQRSQAAGMNEHITKPIDPDILYRTLSKYLVVSEEEQQEPVELEQEGGMKEGTILEQLTSIEGLDTVLALSK